MNSIGWIFARGGSKGLPDKNIRLMAGKPLIAWAIEQAKNSQAIDDVMVSTDSEQIADVAKQFGATIPFMRPAHLAKDDSPEWLAWQHAAQWQEEHFSGTEGFVSVPATSPLRLSSDIDTAVDRLTMNVGMNCDLVLAVTPSQHHPSFNMVYKSETEKVDLVLPLDSIVTRRQDAKPVFNITTVVYATSVRHVLTAKGVLAGNISSIEVPPDRAADIDTINDFHWVEHLYRIKHG